MHRMSVAAACAAMLFALSTAAAPAGLPIRGSVVKGGRNCPPYCKSARVGLGPEGHRVIVTFSSQVEGSNPVLTSYAYNPVDGNINQLPTPQQGTPIIGATVKGGKNPGGNYVNMTVDTNGAAQFPSDWSAGNYSIVITVPAHAVNTKGTGAQNVRMTATGTTPAATTVSLPKQPMLLTFHVVVDAKGNMTMDPRMQPTVTAAPPREPTQ